MRHFPPKVLDARNSHFQRSSKHNPKSTQRVQVPYPVSKWLFLLSKLLEAPKLRSLDTLYVIQLIFYRPNAFHPFSWHATALYSCIHLIAHSFTELNFSALSSTAKPLGSQDLNHFTHLQWTHELSHILNMDVMRQWTEWGKQTKRGDWVEWIICQIRRLFHKWFIYSLH